MFWDRSYTPSQNIEALLNKENATVEEFLDEDDILQECKFKKNIIEYFTRPDIIKRLVELVTTEPSEDLPLAQRFRHANMACEVLTFGLPYLNAKLLSDDDILRTLYSYLENKPPLNPLLSSFFSKTFSMLFRKSFYQDWFLYQKMCLQLIEYIKLQGNFLDLIFNHFSTPVIPDLLMQMMNDVEGGAIKQNLYDWLIEEKMVERLIAILGDAKEADKHANVSEFLCELITQCRSIRQTVQENDFLEPPFIGSNPILQVIESEATITSLFNVILEPSVNEHAIISGILVVLTLIKPVVFGDDPASQREQIMQEKEKENHENIISTVIRVVRPRLNEFIAILQNPPVKPDMLINGAKVLPPFGSTRLEICRLFTVLLQTGNEDIINAICETDYLNTILALFKDYCWNNFLHSEVEKCMQIIFSPTSNNNKSSNNNNNVSTRTTNDGSFQNDDDQVNSGSKNSANGEESGNNDDGDDDTKTKATNGPSALQTFAIVNNKIMSKLIDCWMHNNEMQKAENGRRLGYMGHLMKIFKHITACISESDHIGALIESSLSETELEQWQSIIKPNDGEFTMALAVQNRMLANCKAQKSIEYNHQLSRELLDDDFSTNVSSNFSPEIFNDFVAAVNDLFIKLDDFTPDISMDTIQSYTRRQNANSLIGAGGGDPFNDLSVIGQSETSGSDEEENVVPNVDWGDFSDNFADFDAHFSSFTNDMGESLSETKNKDGETLPVVNAPAVNSSFSSSPPSATANSDSIKSEFDNNANVEKAVDTLLFDPFEDDNDDVNFGSGASEQGNGDAGTDDAWAGITEDETIKNSTVTSNGPTAIQDTKYIDELTNKIQSALISDSSLHSSIKTQSSSTFNEDEEQQPNALPDNITENINPPPSANESLCQEKTSSISDTINQETKTNISPAPPAWSGNFL